LTQVTNYFILSKIRSK